MGTAANGIFDAVGKFTDGFRTNHLAVAEMQKCGFGRVFNLERKSKRNLDFFGTTDHASYLKTPLANCVHCGFQKKWVTGNGLQLYNFGILIRDNQCELDDPFDVREPSFSRINGIHGITSDTAQLFLREVEARLRGRCGALGRCLCEENRE